MAANVTPEIVESRKVRDTVNGVYTTVGSLTYLGCASAADITNSRQRIKFLDDADDTANYSESDIEDLNAFPLHGNSDRNPELVVAASFSVGMIIKSLSFQNVGIAEGVWVDISNVAKGSSQATTVGAKGVFFIPDGGIMEFCVKSTEHITFITEGTLGMVLVVARL